MTLTDYVTAEDIAKWLTEKSTTNTPMELAKEICARDQGKIEAMAYILSLNGFNFSETATALNFLDEAIRWKTHHQ